MHEFQFDSMFYFRCSDTNKLQKIKAILDCRYYHGSCCYSSDSLTRLHCNMSKVLPQSRRWIHHSWDHGHYQSWRTSPTTLSNHSRSVSRLAVYMPALLTDASFGQTQCCICKFLPDNYSSKILHKVPPNHISMPSHTKLRNNSTISLPKINEELTIIMHAYNYYNYVQSDMYAWVCILGT